MRIILLGAPGAGKGTQSQFITKKYGIPQISTGDMLRNIIESHSKLDKHIINTLNTGKLIDNELIIELVRKRISQEDCRNGFLLDGFPRTVIQADAVKAAGVKIDYVLELEIPEKLIFERILGRRVHAESGRVYHVKFNPPKIAGEDDLTGKELTIRKDDQEQSVLFRRLSEYHQLTVPLISFYNKEAKAGNVKYAKVNSAKSILEVRSDIMKIID